MNGVIIYLFGFAGCGKFTIATAIQARFDCILVDNHHINNVIFSRNMKAQHLVRISRSKKEAGG